MRRTLVLFALVLAAVPGCSDETPASGGEVRAGLSAEPRWLTFDCVKNGCDATLKVTVAAEGTRRIAVKRVVLSDPARTDFLVASAQTTPFVVGEPFEVTVRHLPGKVLVPEDVKLLISYADASPESAESDPNRIPPGELEVPLLRRLLGEPAMEVTPEQLQISGGQPGKAKIGTLTVKNTGFGNTTLSIAKVESDSEWVKPLSAPETAVAPGESVEQKVSFVPKDERFVRATVRITAAEPGVSPAVVPVLATSLQVPQAASLPEKADFQEVAKGQKRTLSLELLNQGGKDLILNALRVEGCAGDVAAAFPKGAEEVTLKPLDTRTLSVKLDARTAGPLECAVKMGTNDPGAGTFSVPVVGLVTEPRLKASPQSVDFGKVPQGWVKSQPITVENSGYGQLLVKKIALTGNSNKLFSLRSVPVLPAYLEREQRMGFEVVFSSGAISPFEGTVSIESDDPVTPFTLLPVKAQGVTCADGCPLPHAKPTCASGECRIDTCDARWFDTDDKDETGCECGDASDPGGLCPDGQDLGQFSDGGDERSVSGVLPTTNDADAFRFYAVDNTWGGEFNVRIQLTTADPNVFFSVGFGAEADCHPASGGNSQLRDFTEDGGWASNDSGYYDVRVYRVGGKPVTCKGYTLTVSNGK